MDPSYLTATNQQSAMRPTLRGIVVEVLVAMDNSRPETAPQPITLLGTGSQAREIVKLARTAECHKKAAIGESSNGDCAAATSSHTRHLA